MVSKVFNDGGNLAVHYSDNIVNLGNLDPTVALQVIATQCVSDGSCSPLSWKDTGMKPHGVPGGTALLASEFEFQAQGEYKSWIHNGLYEALMTAIAKSVKKDLVKYTTPAGDCKKRALCGREGDEVWQYSIPDWIAVYYHDPTDCGGFASHMGVSTTVPDGKGSGFCSTFATVSGAVAGAVEANPIIGGFLSLLGLVCANNGL